MTSRFLGRDPATVAADLAELRKALGDGIEDASSLWHELDALSRNTTASSYLRRRAKTAADALGSMLDDLLADFDPEQPFTWNDPPESEETAQDGAERGA